ncbi:hypothetical protein [Roseococcus sp.]|uniref:hypothetical protein n=1 Tax=Roseococcus sp. TaxID=2109646 RepID=UPI003BA97366
MGNIWAEIGLAIAALALLILLVPRRWLGRTILLWLVSPLIVYVAVILWESITLPTRYGLGNAVYGFMLISSILALPWLIGSALGLAIGFGLRRLLRREPPQPRHHRPCRSRPRSCASRRTVRSAWRSRPWNGGVRDGSIPRA